VDALLSHLFGELTKPTIDLILPPLVRHLYAHRPVAVQDRKSYYFQIISALEVRSL